MQLQYDNLEDTPEELRESFVEFKDGDKTVFLHKDLAEVKKEYFRTKGDLTQAQRTAQEKADKLQALEDADKERAALIEQERIAGLQKNGQHEEILADTVARAKKREEELQAQLSEMTGSVFNEKKGAIVADLASLGTDSTRSVLKRLIDSDLARSDDNKLIVMVDGKATSLTVEEYKAQLPDLYPSLVSESHGKGGQSKGALGSSGNHLGVPKTLADCKGDKKLETEYFKNKLINR